MGTLRIVSRSRMRFIDRTEAGRLLAQEMEELHGRGVVVLGIPRGGLVIAAEIARIIEGKLDIVLAHKIGAPGHPELAIGSVSEDGTVFIDPITMRQLGVSSHYIQQESARQQAQMERRAEMIRRVRPKEPLKDRVVVITDDGIATGATASAAIWAVKGEAPQRIIGAFPVGSEDRVRQLAEEVDEMICLRTPPDFAAVGQFYERFDQVSDQEVLNILTASLTKEGVR